MDDTKKTDYANEALLQRKKIGMRIKTLRQKAKMSQADLADKIGISSNFMSQIENGHYKASDKNLLQFADVLGVSVGYIMGFGPDGIDVADFLSAKQNDDSDENPNPRISQATLDLEAMVKDLVYEYPDLAIGFRDTRANWNVLPEEDKQSIADGLMSLFYPDPSRPSRLRDRGRKGQV